MPARSRPGWPKRKSTGKMLNSAESSSEVSLNVRLHHTKAAKARSAGREVPYTSAMSIVRNIAAISKCMSITFREMFQPTEVENYQDGPGPNRGAVLQERYRGAHVLQRDENG